MLSHTHAKINCLLRFIDTNGPKGLLGGETKGQKVREILRFLFYMRTKTSAFMGSIGALFIL